MNAPTANLDTPPAIESSFQLERDKHALLHEQHALKPLPNLTLLREAVTDAAALAAHDPGQFASKHDAAQHLLAEALRKHERHRELSDQIANIDLRIEISRQRERQQAAQQADNQLTAALDEYRNLAKATAKAYRVLLNANRLSGATHGAQTIAPPRSFNIPHLLPAGRSGTLGEVMMDTLMPWEQSQ